MRPRSARVAHAARVRVHASPARFTVLVLAAFYEGEQQAVVPLWGAAWEVSGPLNTDQPFSPWLLNGFHDLILGGDG